MCLAYPEKQRKLLRLRNPYTDACQIRRNWQVKGCIGRNIQMRGQESVRYKKPHVQRACGRKVLPWQNKIKITCEPETELAIDQKAKDKAQEVGKSYWSKQGVKTIFLKPGGALRKVLSSGVTFFNLFQTRMALIRLDKLQMIDRALPECFVFDLKL